MFKTTGVSRFEIGPAQCWAGLIIGAFWGFRIWGLRFYRLRETGFFNTDNAVGLADGV